MEKEKAGTYTKSEILSQPETWDETIQKLKSDSQNIIPDFKKYDHVVFTGCGSTHYLSIWAARLFQKFLGISSNALPASELWYSISDWIIPYKKPLLIAVSRSGETTETIKAVEVFKEKRNGDVVSITCYPESKLSKISDITFSTPAGKEKSIAQTRSFTNMMCAVLYLIDGEVPNSVISDFQRVSKEFIDKYQEKAKVIGQDDSHNRFFFLGDGPLFGLANEAMLKQKEISLSYSEAFHFMEFRHGPMSMVDTQSLIIGLFSSWAQDFELAVLNDMMKLDGRTIGVGRLVKGVGNLNSFFMLPEMIPPHWSYPLYLPVLQLIAYEKAIAKGLDPDKPNNLSAVIEL